MSGEQETITREERLLSGSETNNNHLFARGTLYGFADAKEIFQLLKILSLFKADLKLIATELLLSPKGRYKCPKQHTKRTKKSHWWNMPNFASKMA